MGRTKRQKEAAARDEPGIDDFTFLAVFFPVGRNGAALARDSDMEDQKAANRIGMWLNEAGLPIRKLFARKSVRAFILYGLNFINDGVRKSMSLLKLERKSLRML